MVRIWKVEGEQCRDGLGLVMGLGWPSFGTLMGPILCQTEPSLDLVWTQILTGFGLSFG